VANPDSEVSSYAERYTFPSFKALDSIKLRPLSKVGVEAKIHLKNKKENLVAQLCHYTQKKEI
jgi:hypothetical protein